MKSVDGHGAGEAVVTVIVAVLAAEDTDAAGRADRVLRVGAREAHAFGRKPVHVGRKRLRVSFAAHASRLVLVRQDQQDIRLFVGGHGVWTSERDGLIHSRDAATSSFARRALTGSDPTRCRATIISEGEPMSALRVFTGRVGGSGR